MSVNNLEFMFRPQSVAVIGASNAPGNPGHIVMKNLMGSGFKGPVMPVSQKEKAIAGVLTYPDAGALPITPDLAVICDTLAATPGLVARLGDLGTRAAILVNPGYSEVGLEERKQLGEEIMRAAAAHEMRLLGPKSLGIIVPGQGLNASLAHTNVLPGKIAFISQSDSLFTMVLDWARSNSVGFSHLISLGHRLDVSFSSVMDYLGSDPYTRSILLYVENIKNARYFMSAARAASRNKPILVIRPGQALESVLAEAQASADTGTLYSCEYACSSEIHDVAFKRAGMLRVDNVDALFDAAQTLNRLQPVRGNRLAIVTNGASAGILAADALLTEGRGTSPGQLAVLSEETKDAIDEVLEGKWIRANPVGLRFNAKGEQYAAIIKILLKDKGVDAVLVMHVPFAGLPELEAAQAVADAVRRVKRMVLTAWLGSGSARKARQIFQDAEIPTYDSPEKAIRAFHYMVSYKKGQELLMETPDSLPSDFFPDTTTAREIVQGALGEDRFELTEPEARSVLASYGMPMVETKITTSAKEAVIAADELGYPVALKLRSPQIRQPFDVGGVVLDLETPEKVWEACASILARVSRQRPDAYIEGFTVQRMGRRPGAHELFIGATVDDIFGPVIHFGHGGMAREMIKDHTVALPPLSMSLSRELISRTRISKLLRGTPSQPPADMDDLCLSLIQISQLLIDVPEIINIDINPLYADDTGVLALSAKILVARGQGVGPQRLAIRPYPRELEECVTLKNGAHVTLRPIRPEDEEAHRAFLASLSDDDLRLRFFGVVRRDFGHQDLARFTQIDYDREMAFIAQVQDKRGLPETLGVIRTSTKPDNSEAEFAIVVRSDLKGTGLGSLLFEKMVRYTKGRGTLRMVGETMPENKAMQGLSKKFGARVVEDFNDDTVTMVLETTPSENG